ncbi:glycosyl hydrolase family 18 protein [Myxococcus vastator]|uniref:glycosyl hydrolase family 18 protein n=1 Tax=Myxococcus vastator TaxID=2709664 RepID=UPI00353252F3
MVGAVGGAAALAAQAEAPPPTAVVGSDEVVSSERVPVTTSWIYRDAMEAPWQDYSWAPHSLTNTAPVAAGRYSISVTMRAWEALYFNTSPLTSNAGMTLTLRVHGGVAGNNAVVLTRAVVNGVFTPGTELGPYCTGGRIRANTWATCTVPISLLAPQGAQVTGLVLQEGRGQGLPTLYFDELSVRGIPAPPPPSGKWVSGYYTGWNADLYPPEKVDFSALTHILVGRVTPNPDGTVNTQFDNSNGPAIARTLSMRAHAAGRKAIIMVGGAGEHDGWVGAASDANRARFVQSLLNAVDTFGYDGLDIDWEPVEQADKPALLALIQALRAARPQMLLTMPIGWVNSKGPIRNYLSELGLRT